MLGADHTIRDMVKADTLGFVVVVVLITYCHKGSRAIGLGQGAHVYLLICLLIARGAWERWETTYYGK